MPMKCDHVYKLNVTLPYIQDQKKMFPWVFKTFLGD